MRQLPHSNPWSHRSSSRFAGLLPVESALCAAVSVVVALLAYRSGTPAWALGSTALFGWMVILTFRLNPVGAILLIPNIIGSAASLIALVMIEFGSKIPELGTVGRSNGSTATYILYTLIFFWSYLAFFRLLTSRKRVTDQPITRFFDRYANLIALGGLGFATLLIAYLFVAGLRSGFPLLAGIDRFVYRRYFSDVIMLYTLNWKWMIAIILGMIAFSLPCSRAIKVMACFVGAVSIFVYFLFGDKFFTQLVFAATFFTPYLCENHRVVKQNFWALVLVGALVTTPVAAVTWFIYSNNGRDTPSATLDRLSGRMVGQGQLWFLQNQIGADIVSWNRDLIDKNLEALSVKETELFALREGVGPAYFSNRFAPDAVRASMQRNAGTVTYTSALEALGLAAFGWTGLVGLMAVTGLIAALASAYLLRAVRMRSLVSAIFAVYVLVFVRSYISQGAVWQVIGLYSLKWFLVILVIELTMALLNRSQMPVPRARRAQI